MRECSRPHAKTAHVCVCVCVSQVFHGEHVSGAGPHGHSFEARLYAETPRNNFLPGERSDTHTHIHTHTHTPIHTDKWSYADDGTACSVQRMCVSPPLYVCVHLCICYVCVHT